MYTFNFSAVAICFILIKLESKLCNLHASYGVTTYFGDKAKRKGKTTKDGSNANLWTFDPACYNFEKYAWRFKFYV